MDINLPELVLSNLLRLVIGLATSFFSWWVLFHFIVPKVEFSDAISKIPRRSGKGHLYRIKFLNTGRRGVIGVEVYARLTFTWTDTKNITGLYVPLSNDGAAKHEIPRLGPDKDRILSLRLGKVPSFRTNTRYPPEFREKAQQNAVTLEDVLSVGKSASLQIYVSGYDEFSGARKIFLSPKYGLAEISAGRFKRLKVTEKQTEAAETAETPPPPEGTGDAA
jgi:hypothetical protein